MFVYIIAGLPGLSAFAGIIILLVVLSSKKKKRVTWQNANNYSFNFDNNYITYSTETQGCQVPYNPPEMNNDNTHNNPNFSDKVHNGIPDQFNNHDYRFGNTLNNSSASSSDSGGSSFDLIDIGSGSSGGGSDNNNF